MWDIGPLEMVALIVIAIVVFGPDQLPRRAAQAARGLRTLREFAADTRDEVHTHLQDVAPDLKITSLKDLNPRTLVRKALIVEDEPGLRDEPRPRDQVHR
ncbi:twin-arginine translocase TatA/TatE family subunit (plasmid) [Streptomycetaceae bacterium NBC_01309]